MLKSQNKKVSAEFIAHLKNTPEIPIKNKNKKPIQEHNLQSTASRVIQQDFSKISSSYVLQNQCLRKKSFIYGNKHQQDYQDQKPVVMQDIQMIKKLAKLQYLQKKGYLKPEEQQILDNIRSKNTKGQETFKFQEYPQYSQQSNIYQNKQNDQGYYNMPTKMSHKSIQHQQKYTQHQHEIPYNNHVQKHGNYDFDPYHYNKNMQIPYQQNNYQYQQQQTQMDQNHAFQNEDFKFVNGNQGQYAKEFMGYKFNQ